MRPTAIHVAASPKQCLQAPDPAPFIIDIVQFFEVLRLEMVTGCKAVWEVVESGALRISFPTGAEADMVIPAGQWQRDAARRQKGHLRLV